MDTQLVTIFVSLLLLIMSALFSGLTLGLMSLSTFELKRKKELGDKRAIKVFPIRERGNELLATLIIGNVLVNAALTVMLNSFLAGFMAVVIATVLITIFGEILPQAALKKHGLDFGARFARYIQWFMMLLWPITYPLAKVLDSTIGGDLPTIYSKGELVKILEEHEKSEDSSIEADELRIVENALQFGDRAIEEVMTPKSVVKTVSSTEPVGPVLMKELHETGFSRFPVYEEDEDNIVGILYLQDLIKPSKGRKYVRDLVVTDVYFVNEHLKLDHALNAFLRTKNHLFIAVNEFQEMVGVITIEDILEQIIGREIVDEFDKYDDMREVAKLEAHKRAQQNPVGSGSAGGITSNLIEGPIVEKTIAERIKEEES